MKSVTLQKIVSDRSLPRTMYNDNEEAEADEQTQGRELVCTPCVVMVDAIRCFYPRRDNRPGTRITFRDGGGFAVSEPFEEVQRLIGMDMGTA